MNKTQKDLKTTEAQRRAFKNYREKNKEDQKWKSYRRGARNYIFNKANQEELDELSTWIAEKEQQLKNEQNDNAKEHIEEA